MYQRHFYSGVGQAYTGTAYNPYGGSHPYVGSAYNPGPVARTRQPRHYSGYGCCGLGANTIGFNSNTVWADLQACQAAGGQGLACKRGADAVRVALGQLGYGDLPLGVMWGNADMATLDQFIADHGLSPRVGIGPSKGHLNVMQELLDSGQVPGSQAVPEVNVVGGEYVKTGGTATAKASVGNMLLVGAVALGAMGLLAVLAKKRKKRAK